MAAGGLLAEPVMAPHWWVDLCLRLRAASDAVFTPFAALRMACKGCPDGDVWPGSSAEVAASEEHLRDQWQNWIVDDPAYSPNLSVQPVRFSWAWPSRTPRWSEWSAAKSQHPPS